MDLWWTKTTPANTAKEDALELELKLTAGTIVQVWMMHPEGCHGLAYASIWHGGHQLYPHNPAEAYHGNDVPMIWDDNFELKTPAILKLKTWNLDDKYEHTVYLRITLIRAKLDPIQRAMLGVLRSIEDKLVGRRIG